MYSDKNMTTVVYILPLQVIHILKGLNGVNCEVIHEVMHIIHILSG